MRRTHLFVTVAFLAGLALGLVARTVYTGMLPRRTHAADFAAIEKAHQEDIEATLMQDPKKLINLWEEDAVNFIPGSSPAVGKLAIEAEHEKFRAQYPGFKVSRYTPKYKNIQVEDGLACEWFEREGEYKLSADSPLAKWQAKGLQVLKRQSDGSWKGVMVFVSQQ